MQLVMSQRNPEKSLCGSVTDGGGGEEYGFICQTWFTSHSVFYYYFFIKVSPGGRWSHFPRAHRDPRHAGGIGHAAAGERRAGNGTHAWFQHRSLHQPVHSTLRLLPSYTGRDRRSLSFNVSPDFFQVPVHVFLDLSTLECTHLSDPAEMFILDLMDCNNNYTSRDVRVNFRTSIVLKVLLSYTKRNAISPRRVPTFTNVETFSND